MKRVLTILAILLLPLSVMAMSPVSDNEMANVTGQSGVTIDITALQISFAMDTVTWGDYDGFDRAAIATSAAYAATFESPDQYLGTQSTLAGTVILNGVVGMATNSGYINMAFANLISHIALKNPMRITFDVGTYTGQVALGEGALLGVNTSTGVSTWSPLIDKTAIKIGISKVNMSMDAFGLKGIYLDKRAGAAVDYAGNVNSQYNRELGGPGIGNGITGEAGSIWDPVDYYATSRTGTTEGNMGTAGFDNKNLGSFGFSGLEVGVNACTVYIYAH